MPRKLIFVDQAAEFLQVDPVQVAENDPMLGEMIQAAQTETWIKGIAEAYGSRIYRPRPVSANVGTRSEQLKLWGFATDDCVTFFAVQLSVDGGRTFINPLDLLP